MNQTDLSRVNLNLLVLFEIIFEERHVGRAAERMALTPSAISHGLKRLRSLLGDPLFVRNPKGVTPTERALELAEPIAAVLAQVRGVLDSAAPFDPSTSSRRFVIGAPDAVAAALLPPLLADLRARAPRLEIAVRELLPMPGRSSYQAWRNALGDLDTGSLDIAIIPATEVPTRFHARQIYEEDFVIALREGHPLASGLDFASYCAASHVMVSQSGDRTGFVDQVLEREGLSRRVVLTVPNFFVTLSVLGESDLLAAVPRRFAQRHARRFGVATVEPPMPFGKGPIMAVSPAAALADAGLAWFFEMLEQTAA